MVIFAFEFVDKTFKFDSSLKMKHLNYQVFSFFLSIIYLLYINIEYF